MGTGVWGYGAQGQEEMCDQGHKDTMIGAWGHRDKRLRTSIGGKLAKQCSTLTGK